MDPFSRLRSKVTHEAAPEDAPHMLLEWVDADRDGRATPEEVGPQLCLLAAPSFADKQYDNTMIMYPELCNSIRRLLVVVQKMRYLIRQMIMSL